MPVCFKLVAYYSICTFRISAPDSRCIIYALKTLQSLRYRIFVIILYCFHRYYPLWKNGFFEIEGAKCFPQCFFTERCIVLLEMILIWFSCEYIIIVGFKINFLINQLNNNNSNNDRNICICKRCIRKMKMANISFHLNRIEWNMKFVWFCHIWDYQESFHGAII